MRSLLLAFLLLLGRPAFSSPALWAVQGPHATVYLLGSVHMLRPGVQWETPAIRHAFDDASECWFELASPDDPKVAALLLTQGMDLQHELSAELPPQAREKLRAVAGGDLGKMEHMRPWLAIVFLGARTAERAGLDAKNGVDQVLQSQARDAGKPIQGLETAESQVRVLADIPDRDMLPALAEEIDEDAQGVAYLDRVTELWLAGDPDALGEVVNKEAERTNPILARRLFADRNRAFATAIMRMAQGDKTVLVTVGAGHLSGPGGVPKLLAEKGLAVVRVE